MGLLQLLRYSEERKTASDCIRELEQGLSIEVEGYQWSPKLWRDSFNFELPPAMNNEEASMQKYRRPVKSIILAANAAPLAKKGIVGGGDEIRDLSWLYSDNFEWMNGAVASFVGGGSDWSNRISRVVYLGRPKCSTSGHIPQTSKRRSRFIGRDTRPQSDRSAVSEFLVSS
jgi:hypothetical protein